MVVSQRPLITRRQAQFLALLAEGHNYDEIAEEVSISRWTVKNTIVTARERLGAKTNEQAVARAVTLRLVVLDWKTSPHLLQAA